MKIGERIKIRTEIAKKIRALRVERHWTQAELSKELGLSQGRFSEIERGQGSFTAEQFLEVLKLFNVPVSQFAVVQSGTGSGIENALSRLGAIHLEGHTDVLPSERLEEAGDVVREALLGAESPRHITSLAPVLVRNLDRINLNKLRAQFLEYGLERRLGWLFENTLQAVRQELSGGLPREAATLYRRAELLLSAWLVNAPLPPSPTNPGGTLDILDAQILNENSLRKALNSASALSEQWGIATALQPDDFIEALKASRAVGSKFPERPAASARVVVARKNPAPDHRVIRAAVPDPVSTRHQGHGSSNPVEMDWD